MQLPPSTSTSAGSKSSDSELAATRYVLLEKRWAQLIHVGEELQTVMVQLDDPRLSIHDTI
jgi:hypothetical protein